MYDDFLLAFDPPILWGLHDPTNCQDEFFSQLLIIVKRKKTYQLVIDEGRYSESELEELGWSK